MVRIPLEYNTPFFPIYLFTTTQFYLLQLLLYEKKKIRYLFFRYVDNLYFTNHSFQF